MGKSRVTMRDIARKLGIDPSTVSLALRNSPLITEAVKEKVREAGEIMGYEPDPMLTALAHYRHGSAESPIRAELAWLNRWNPPETQNIYREFDRYWQGACAVAKSNGYRLEQFIIRDQPLQDFEKVLRARNIKGILIPPHPFVEQWQMPWERYSIIRFGYSTPNVPAHMVAADQFGAGALAYQKIHEKGYRRIGFVTTTRAESGTLFSGGFLLTESRLAPKHRLPFLLLRQKSVSEDKKHLAAWLKHWQPDAIFTTVGEIPSFLADLGCKVPDDIGLAASSVLDGNIDAGIDQNGFELGRLAVELLTSLINHNHRGFPEIQRTTSAAVRWVDGPSLPARAT